MTDNNITHHASRITPSSSDYRLPTTDNSPRALVTGAGGFVGRHLLAYLLAQTDWHIYGNAHAAAVHTGDLRVRWVASDLTDKAETVSMVDKVRPDFVFHLAAQSNVQQAFKDPEKTFMTNVIGQLNLLDALRERVPRLAHSSFARLRSTASFAPKTSR